MVVGVERGRTLTGREGSRITKPVCDSASRTCRRNPRRETVDAADGRDRLRRIAHAVTSATGCALHALAGLK